MKLFSDNLAYKLPISVKGMVYWDKKYLLRHNERNEWELVGGKLEFNEEPISCLAREIEEETGIKAEIGSLLDAWVYKLDKKTRVLILSYECKVKNLTLPIESPEGAELSWFSSREVKKLRMPEGYKKTIGVHSKAMEGKGY